MATTTRGWELLGASIRDLGFQEFFFIMGGPISDAAVATMEAGVRGIDVRHETAAVMAAHAASRLRRRPAICMAVSGPGSANMAPGLLNAKVDGAPVVALGGASSLREHGIGAFQECSQFDMLSGAVKYAERVYEARRLPERLARACAIAMSPRPGPVYLELPGDMLYDVVEDPVGAPPLAPTTAGAATEEDLDRAMELLGQARSPIVAAGSGVLWSDASADLRRFVEAAGIPVYTTPQTRGVLPDDHDLVFSAARSLAFRETDLILVLGTRMNYVWSHFSTSRFPNSPAIIQVDTDPTEIASARPVDLGIVADPGEVLRQLARRTSTTGDLSSRFADWRAMLRDKDAARRDSVDVPDTPPGELHPLAICHALRSLMDREDILVVDGQDILAYARQSIPSFTPGHRLNSGTFGTMGVGVPYGIGAKLARPGNRVVVLTGDGALGFSFMELDTAARHGIDLKVIVSLNGGHTADPEKKKPGRDLGYTEYHTLATALGWHGEYVNQEQELTGAIQRAFDYDGPALVNVVTDWRARAGRAKFTSYET